MGDRGNYVPGPRRKLVASLQEESIEKHPSIADLSSVPSVWAGSTSLGCSISAEKVWLIFGPVPHLWASSTSLGCSTSKTCSTSHAFPLFLKVSPRSGDPSEARTARKLAGPKRWNRPKDQPYLLSSGPCFARTADLASLGSLLRGGTFKKRGNA